MFKYLVAAAVGFCLAVMVDYWRGIGGHGRWWA